MKNSLNCKLLFIENVLSYISILDVTPQGCLRMSVSSCYSLVSIIEDRFSINVGEKNLLLEWVETKNLLIKKLFTFSYSFQKKLIKQLSAGQNARRAVGLALDALMSRNVQGQFSKAGKGKSGKKQFDTTKHYTCIVSKCNIHHCYAIFLFF